MVYAIVYVEHADVVEEFEAYSEAKAALEKSISDHPDVAHRVGILPFGDDGAPGEFEPAVGVLRRTRRNWPSCTRSSAQSSGN
jgi:hypothetical protein